MKINAKDHDTTQKAKKKVSKQKPQEPEVKSKRTSVVSKPEVKKPAFIDSDEGYIKEEATTSEQIVTTHPVGTKIEPHPLSRIVPRRSPKERETLKNDIEKNGLLSPGITYKEKLLDGNERQDVCAELGIHFQTVEYEGDDPLSVVLAKQCHNKKLKISQKSIFAARLANLKPGSNQHERKGPANLQNRNTQDITDAEAANLVEVSIRYVQVGKSAIKFSEKLANAVSECKVSLPLAMRAMQHPELKEDIDKALDAQNPAKALKEMLDEYGLNGTSTEMSQELMADLKQMMSFKNLVKELPNDPEGAVAYVMTIIVIFQLPFFQRAYNEFMSRYNSSKQISDDSNVSQNKTLSDDMMNIEYGDEDCDEEWEEPEEDHFEEQPRKDSDDDFFEELDDDADDSEEEEDDDSVDEDEEYEEESDDEK